MAQTLWAIDRRSTTAGDRHEHLQDAALGTVVSAGRCEPIRTSLVAGWSLYIDDQPGGLCGAGTALQGPQPGQQLGEMKGWIR